MSSKTTRGVVSLLLTFAALTSTAATIVDNSEAAVTTRLSAPDVAVADLGPALAQRPAGPLTPAVIYDNHCVVCHGAGVAGAPKLKDKGAWAPRIAEGIDVLYQHVLHGYKMMPARGTCTECTDDELKATFEWMIAQ
ncbi:MAG: c-type cytochrome [Pseudomonadota bacterium]